MAYHRLFINFIRHSAFKLVERVYDPEAPSGKTLRGVVHILESFELGIAHLGLAELGQMNPSWANQQRNFRRARLG